LELGCNEAGFTDQQRIRDLRAEADLSPAATKAWLDAASALEAVKALPGAKFGATPAESKVGGVRLGKVGADSAAARAGLAEGDIVLSVDGAAVNVANFAALLKEKLPGDVLELVVVSQATLKQATPDGAELTARSLKSLPSSKISLELGGGSAKGAPMTIESLRGIRRIAGLQVFGEK
jgi:S1-C subfamily serine protease